MADLKALFGKPTNAAPPPAKPVDSPQSGQVPRTATVATTATPKPTNPFARRGNSGQGDSGQQPVAGTPTGSGNVGGNSQPESGLSPVPSDTGTPSPSVDSGSVDAAPITSLDQLDSTEDAGVAPREGVSYFADETPAIKPTRELPEGITKESLGFIDMLDTVYNVIHDPELLGGQITNIMVELKSNPEYARLIAPDDVRVMVRGMRESMGLARVKKQEAKTKRSGGGAKRGSKMLDADMLADLESLGING